MGAVHVHLRVDQVRQGTGTRTGARGQKDIRAGKGARTRTGAGKGTGTGTTIGTRTGTEDLAKEKETDKERH